MTPSFSRARLACVAGIAAFTAASACGSGNKTQTGASGNGGSSTTTSHGGSSTTSSTGDGTGAGPLANLSLPQFVHGAAYVDTLAFPQFPVVVGVTGAMPSGVTVTVDGVATPAVADSGRFVATVAMTLAAGPHTLVATATGGPTGMVSGTLVAGGGSFQLTDFAKVGPAYEGHLWHDVPGDALDYTWVDVATGKHALYFNTFDGGFAPLAPSDVVLNDPADEPLSGYTAPGPTGIGVVYHTANPSDGHWRVNMRIVDPTGKELVPVMDLTAGQSAFLTAQAGADPGGFSGAWLHITPPVDPSNPPPVEIRFSRWDLGAKKLVGPLTLDMDQPQAMGSTEGPQTLEPQAEIGIACNAAVCLVAYTRDLYNQLVLLNIPKLFLATVDLASGQLAGPPVPVEATDWDTQEWGQHLVALADGTFVLIYTANDTAAAVNPKSPCDTMLERDTLFTVKIDATGKLVGKPKALFDNEGTREYPRIAEHPAGFALFWEDQRSECNAGGHIRMAANVAGSGLSALLDPYLEIPGSIALPPEYPTLAVAGTNVVVGWSDNRNGNGLVDPKPEIYFDTYWRK